MTGDTLTTGIRSIRVPSCGGLMATCERAARWAWRCPRAVAWRRRPGWRSRVVAVKGGNLTGCRHDGQPIGIGAAAAVAYGRTRRSGRATTMSRCGSGAIPVPSQASADELRGLSCAGACNPTVHRPPRPARGPQTARRAGPQPALVLAHRHPGSVPVGRPQGLGQLRGRPDPAAGRRLGRAAADARRRTRSSSRACGWSRPTWPSTSPATCGTRATPPRTRPRRRRIGYFSPEFGITEVLPQYSGGLGILAGDHLKAASDLGVPIIGVGLLYRARATSGSR